MIPEIKRILCATDLSDKSTATYRYAIQKACDDNADLLVCHVISQRSITLAKRMSYFFNETRKDIVKEKTSAALKSMKVQLGVLFKNEFKDHPEYADHIEHLLVYHGNIAEELVEKANRFGCDAIVLGSHHSSLVKRFFPGGTAKEVLNQTRKSIFLVSSKNGKIDIRSYNE